MNLFKEIENKKVLLQLSGGKDSVACLMLLKENNIDFEAIHFAHKWCYDIPTQVAQKICDEQNIKLNIVDVSENVKEVFLDNYKERPCRNCKSVMDRITVEYAEDNGFNYICVGDSKSDTMLINRLIEDISVENEDDLYINRYFNAKVNLPQSISIIRPLVNMKNEDIFAYLKTKNVEVKRVNDTGDKYFEYSREGCPLQFKDFGEAYTEELMDNLLAGNKLCSEFATENGIRASVHLPSGFIVTIPEGYESACEKYLNERGFRIDRADQEEFEQFERTIFSVRVNKGILEDKEILEKAILRVCERLEVKIKKYIDNDEFINITLDKGALSVYVNAANRTLNFNFTYKDELDEKAIENIIIEIFHTRTFSIHKYKEL